MPSGLHLTVWQIQLSGVGLVRAGGWSRRGSSLVKTGRKKIAMEIDASHSTKNARNERVQSQSRMTRQLGEMDGFSKGPNGGSGESSGDRNA